MTKLPEEHPRLKGFVAKLTAMRGPGDSLDVYEAWANTYEEDLTSNYGYVAPRIAVDAFAEISPEADSVIDFGCGTGLVGVALYAAGYTRVDGVDISPAMLSEARAKGVYRNLLEADLSKQAALPEGHYAGAIAVGCFGSGHLGPEHFGGLIRAVRPGGTIVLYTNGIPYLEDDYPAHIDSLVARGVWEVVKTEESNYMESRERPGWVIVAKRGEGNMSQHR